MAFIASERAENSFLILVLNNFVLSACVHAQSVASGTDDGTYITGEATTAQMFGLYVVFHVAASIRAEGTLHA